MSANARGERREVRGVKHDSKEARGERGEVRGVKHDSKEARGERRQCTKQPSAFLLLSPLSSLHSDRRALLSPFSSLLSGGRP
jgi:hypothetical protein